MTHNFYLFDIFSPFLFKILKDANKRKTYDLMGDTGDPFSGRYNQQQAQRQQHQRQYQQQHQQDFPRGPDPGFFWGGQSSSAQFDAETFFREREDLMRELFQYMQRQSARNQGATVCVPPSKPN
jgi:hypothetical protein